MVIIISDTIFPGQRNPLPPKAARSRVVRIQRTGKILWLSLCCGWYSICFDRRHRSTLYVILSLPFIILIFQILEQAHDDWKSM